MKEVFKLIHLFVELIIAVNYKITEEKDTAK